MVHGRKVDVIGRLPDLQGTEIFQTRKWREVVKGVLVVVALHPYGLQAGQIPQWGEVVVLDISRELQIPQLCQGPQRSQGDGYVIGQMEAQRGQRRQAGEGGEVRLCSCREVRRQLQLLQLRQIFQASRLPISSRFKLSSRSSVRPERSDRS